MQAGATQPRERARATANSVSQALAVELVLLLLRRRQQLAKWTLHRATVSEARGRGTAGLTRDRRLSLRCVQSTQEPAGGKLAARPSLRSIPLTPTASPRLPDADTLLLLSSPLLLLFSSPRATPGSHRRCTAPSTRRPAPGDTGCGDSTFEAQRTAAALQLAAPTLSAAATLLRQRQQGQRDGRRRSVRTAVLAFGRRPVRLHGCCSGCCSGCFPTASRMWVSFRAVNGTWWSTGGDGCLAILTRLCIVLTPLPLLTCLLPAARRPLGLCFLSLFPSGAAASDYSLGSVDLGLSQHATRSTDTAAAAATSHGDEHKARPPHSR